MEKYVAAETGWEGQGAKVYGVVLVLIRPSEISCRPFNIYALQEDASVELSPMPYFCCTFVLCKCT